MKNKYAVELGKLGKGIPKRITPEDSKRRSERLAEARRILAEKRKHGGCNE